MERKDRNPANSCQNSKSSPWFRKWGKIAWQQRELEGKLIYVMLIILDTLDKHHIHVVHLYPRYAFIDAHCHLLHSLQK